MNGDRYKILEEKVKEISDRGYDLEIEKQLIQEARAKCDDDYTKRQLEERNERWYN
jgi:hypothetical protein